jgi:uncharacterized DUF497 family protein
LGKGVAAGCIETLGAATSAEVEQVFFNAPLLLLEPRFHALGKTLEDRRLHLSFTLRKEATLIRVISARDMSRKERAIYEQASKSHP